MRCLRVRVVTGHSGGSKDQPGDTTVVPRNLVDQGLGLVLAGSEVSKAPWSWQSRVERREAGRVLRQRTRVRVESADRLLNLPAGLGAPIPFGGNGKEDQGWPGTRFDRAAQRWLRAI